ncbi:uncharacterized protein LOC112503202 [Cynara cardunculus var. scolymus]|uniref:DUF6821 domain-containing protein n=1 Tax=Cynara cardunculus var. scolymus TaxID=59895 RepID=A0A118JS47_CYNCS|nr:uncharacterized protein LOC112503202 [Cynara cardunculus var. scolymus]KVH87671.1 hypothetical protein Ccrd_025043 [Cynara cardunculus var. scolymus]
MDVELNDWEVLPNSEDSTSLQNTSYLEGIERDSEGIIRSDYFSLDSRNKYAGTQVEDVTDGISVESDNPSWIDPACDTRYSTTKEMGEFWSTDGSSDDGKYVESEANNKELDIGETGTRQVAYDGSASVEMDKSWSDSGEIESKTRNYEKMDVDTYDDDMKIHEPSGEQKIIQARDQGENEDVLIETRKADSEERNRVAVWWKLPFDLLKYCLYRASPVWTLSVAAAMMGVVILGRRLYKMKRKSRTLQLKVTVDDKKVSQFMSRAARLNEAFSVVKRGPIIRPSLPAAGIAPWPMMALR